MVRIVPVTIDTDGEILERMLAAVGKPVREATPQDVDRVLSAMADGRAAETRRIYVQAFEGIPPIRCGAQGRGDRGRVRGVVVVADLLTTPPEGSKAA